jgi:hypothetical protein
MRSVRVAKIKCENDHRILVDVVFNKGIRIVVTPAKVSDGFLFESIMQSLSHIVAPMGRFNQKVFDAFVANLKQELKNPAIIGYEYLHDMVAGLVAREKLVLIDPEMLKPA